MTQELKACRDAFEKWGKEMHLVDIAGIPWGSERPLHAREVWQAEWNSHISQNRGNTTDTLINPIALDLFEVKFGWRPAEHIASLYLMEWAEEIIEKVKFMEAPLVEPSTESNQPDTLADGGVCINKGNNASAGASTNTNTNTLIEALYQKVLRRLDIAEKSLKQKSGCQPIWRSIFDFIAKDEDVEKLSLRLTERIYKEDAKNMSIRNIISLYCRGNILARSKKSTQSEGEATNG